MPLAYTCRDAGGAHVEGGQVRRNTLPAGGPSFLSQETGARGLPTGAVCEEGQEVMMTHDVYRHFIL